MKLLAFDTSTEVLSIAVGWQRDGVDAVWQHTGVGGPQASAQLIPHILALLAQAGLRVESVARGQARSPGCERLAPWRKGWPSVPACRCCRWTR
jgi:tRNA threonylcarbamoyladenosine biosynthesis protein TsaB